MIIKTMIIMIIFIFIITIIIIIQTYANTTFDYQLPPTWKVIYFYNLVQVPAGDMGAVSIRKTVLPGMAIPMLKIRRPNGRLIFNMEIAIRR